MARTIVLVRHGKAQKSQPGLADTDRALVPGAAETLATSYKTTFSLLNGIESTELWVSPALRARQTAAQISPALVADGIRISKTRELPCLFEQDNATFHELIAQTPEDACIIAVGHIPFMEDELEFLTGADIPFAPGSVAAARLAGSPTCGIAGCELLWYVRGPKVAKPRS